MMRRGGVGESEGPARESMRVRDAIARDEPGRELQRVEAVECYRRLVALVAIAALALNTDSAVRHTRAPPSQCYPWTRSGPIQYRCATVPRLQRSAV